MSDNKVRHHLRDWGLAALCVALLASAALVPQPAGSPYRFPMQGDAFQLAGTFGELRSNHFHSGIDVKTNGGIGAPLLAAREGYVYRIKVSPVGFGKAVYLRHPDGEFTVYAHMDGFSPVIEEFVYQKQYATKQYEQEIYLDEGQLPVRQGELLGYSGNSGNSSGPHLHFEIRDPEERIMNPLMHYSALISDHIAPELRGLALEPVGIGSRVNGRFAKLELKPEGKAGDYRVPQLVRLQGQVGLEYDAIDLLDAAPNNCGVNYARLYLDEELVFAFALDKFSFDHKRYINLHFDYPHYKSAGRKYQRAYVEPGNQLPCFPRGQGLVTLKDDLVHNLRLELADAYGNTTQVRLNVQREAPASLPASLPAGQGQALTARYSRGVCILRLKAPVTRQLQGLEVAYLDGSTGTLPPAYHDGNELVFLLNLRRENPPIFVRDPLAGHKVDLYMRQLLLPDKDNVVREGELQAYFPVGTVFDSLALRLRRRAGNAKSYTDRYEIGSTDEPVFQAFVVGFRPTKAGDPSKMVVARQQGEGWAYVGRELRDDGTIVASTADFGTFCLMADSTAPTIKPLNFKQGATIPASQSTLRVGVSDDFSGIDSQRLLGTIDGNWELFEYDAKSGSISHKLRNRVPGQHVIQIMAYDQANNLAESVFTVTY